MVGSTKAGKIKGWNRKEWEQEVLVDIPVKEANAEDFRPAAAWGA